MVTISVLLLLLSAFSPPVHNRFFTFHLISGSMNQTEGRAACRENHTDLITVYSDEDNADLCNIIQKNCSGYKPGWIGLIRGQFSEKWSNGDPVTFRSLAGVCRTSTYCAAMKADGLWESLQCTETKYFMCYKKGDTEPRQNYHLILENKTWYGAQRYCRSKYTDLVSIRDQQQNEEVKMEGLNSNTPFWIGLLSDDWQWIDGGNSTYRNWMSGFPKSSPDDCVSLGPGGQWNSVPCSNEYFLTLCDNSSIHVSDVAMSWEKALDYCQHGNRAGILNIDSEAEQKELESELWRRRVPAGPLWVGLLQSRLFGFWFWTSGKAAFPYSKWDEGKAPEYPLSQHCGAVDPQRNFSWKDLNCLSHHNAVCHLCSP
ncbi:secretory phospholipase A2 receptor [Silurus asotus]|uniref:Secretory phospholipase A2 receptor n=1 Tax=Silurus asotus TaxID=30991 RepID=A0AAD5AM14_SILAS|nr:secretory phospholipase A2 receptor [Silurus asotus]